MDRLENEGSPREIALTNIVKARMNMIREALPSRMIIFLTICCPTTAAIVATITKYKAAEIHNVH